MRLTRRGALALAGSAVGAAIASRTGWAQTAESAPGGVALTVRSQQISAFLPRVPEQVQFGQLIFRSGLVLSADAKSFGGFSGLWRSADGGRLVAITDQGHWLTARLVRESALRSRLSGLDGAILAPMLNASGQPLSKTRSYDTEALCIDNGVAWVGIERAHEILRFDWAKRGILARGQNVPVPPDVKRLPSNRGLEAIGIAPAGSPIAGAVVAISERSGAVDDPTLGIIVGGPRPGLFRYRLQDGYDVTDLAFLPDGDMLVLERWYRPWRGVGMRLRRVESRTLVPDALVDGKLLIDVDLGHEIDNMEGLAVHIDNGRTILTMISDDNFSVLQRTMLLEFELET